MTGSRNGDLGDPYPVFEPGEGGDAGALPPAQDSPGPGEGAGPSSGSGEEPPVSNGAPDEETPRRRPPTWLVLLGDAIGIPVLAVGLLVGIVVLAVAAGMPLDAGNARAILEGKPLPEGAAGTDASAFPLAALASLPLALLAWALVFGRRQLRGRFRVDGTTVRAGLLGGLGMLAIGALGSWIAGGETPAAFEVMRATHPLVLAPLLVLLAPLGEELYLRGRLFGVLLEVGGRGWAYLASAAVFGLLHLAGGLDYLPLVLAYFGIGLLLAWLRDRTGGLVAPLIAHALNNLAGVLSLYLAHSP